MTLQINSHLLAADRRAAVPTDRPLCREGGLGSCQFALMAALMDVEWLQCLFWNGHHEKACEVLGRIAS